MLQKHSYDAALKDTERKLKVAWRKEVKRERKRLEDIVTRQLTEDIITDFVAVLSL